MRLAVFFQLRLRLSLQNTAELLNPNSLTQTGTKTGGWSGPITLYVDHNIEFGGKIVGGLRIRPAQTNGPVLAHEERRTVPQVDAEDFF